VLFKINEELNYLESYHLIYFDYIKKSKDYLFDFIKNINQFDKTINILINNNGGQYQVKVLTDFIKTKRFLEPFFNIKTEFKSLVLFLKEQIQNEKEIIKLNCFDTVLENLEKIKIWLSQIGI
jgi:hypothetical protein